MVAKAIRSEVSQLDRLRAVLQSGPHCCADLTNRDQAGGTVPAHMAYDEDFAHRLRELLADEDGITEKRMFGGLAFLLHGNMSVGLSGSGELMVRVGPEATDDALARPHTRLFDMTGRPMKGWILVGPEGVTTTRELAAWTRRGLEFARSLPAKVAKGRSPT
jgi:TfoX/Sxy family transcriptional regulator of competence genes